MDGDPVAAFLSRQISASINAPTAVHANAIEEDVLGFITGVYCSDPISIKRGQFLPSTWSMHRPACSGTTWTTENL